MCYFSQLLNVHDAKDVRQTEIHTAEPLVPEPSGTKILPVVLYGCETWSLTFREERRLRVFENRVLRRAFGPKRDEVTGNRENYIMRSLVICIP